MSASRSNQAAINRRASSQQQAPMQQRQTQGVPSQQVYRQYAQQPQQQQPQHFNPQIPVPPTPMQPYSSQNSNNPPPPVQIQGAQNIFIEQAGGQKSGKISVSDAIGLVTLRLGRLETIVNKYEESGLPTNTTEGQPIDNSVLMTLISRIETLEKKQQTQPTITVSSPQVDTTAVIDRIGHIETDMNNLKKHINNMTNTNNNKMDNKFMSETDESLSRLDGDIQQLVRETRELRDNLMKLQTYTMETNQRLVDMVFNNQYSCVQNNDSTFITDDLHISDNLNSISEITQSENLEYKPMENIEYNSETSIDQEPVSTDLKGYIESQLNTDIQG